MRRSLLRNQWITVFTELMDFWEERAERRALMGVSWSIFLARLVEGWMSSGWDSSAVCLGMVR